MWLLTLHSGWVALGVEITLGLGGAIPHDQKSRISTLLKVSRKVRCRSIARSAYTVVVLRRELVLVQKKSKRKHWQVFLSTAVYSAVPSA